MKRSRQVAAFILAGGLSSRMGRDKGLLEFGGVPLVIHTARMLAPLVAGVTVVGPESAYAALGLRVIGDTAFRNESPIEKRRGPLAGIATALASTRSPWSLIVACDLPYLNADWAQWLVARAVGSNGQVVIPQTRQGLEPLAAVYRREGGPLLAAALDRGVRKVIDALADLRLDIVIEREWRRLDPRSRVLKNMNTRRDYDEALKWWRSKKQTESRPTRTRPQPGR